MSTASYYSHFDLDHWLAVKAERNRQGLPNHPERGRLLPDHPLVGKTLVDTQSNQAYVVERVRQDWLQGWYLTAVLNSNGSHRTAVVAAPSCANPTILRQLELFQDQFRVQH